MLACAGLPGSAPAQTEPQATEAPTETLASMNPAPLCNCPHWRHLSLHNLHQPLRRQTARCCGPPMPWTTPFWLLILFTRNTGQYFTGRHTRCVGGR
jgi:hypothetical protein